MVRLVVFFFLLCFSIGLIGQNNVGPGNAISFDGVDDYAILGNIYDDLELPLTISAWIFLDPGGLGTIFASQDNSHFYSGFHFYVVHTAIIIEYGDGSGVGSDFIRGKAGRVNNIFGKWVHVTGVIRSSTDMDIFLNGINIGGTYFGNSQFPMNSSFPTELAKIGYRSTTGVTYYFKGIMDELRIWNRSLTEAEIREQMCRKLTGNETGLAGYWDFNDHYGNLLIDKSRNHFDAQLKGSPKRVFSGAPIGDESVFLYTDDWNDRSLTFEDGHDKVSVGNVTGNPGGLHIYEVHEFPSQAHGLNLSMFAEPYFGVFAASDDADNFFDINYQYYDSTVCKLFTRPDNSTLNWNENTFILTHISERQELIKERWGIILEIDLGQDESLCVLDPRILRPLNDTIGFDFLWQDGSTSSKFEIADFGTYWVTANDGCASATDTLNIFKVAVDSIRIPNVFTPNGDSFNQFFEIDQRMLGGQLIIYNRWGRAVYQTSAYQNNWDGADVPAGVYYYNAKGGYCISEKKGILTILR